MILVSLEDGAAGGAALVERASKAADNRRSKLPPIWIQCHPNSTLEAAVRQYETPNIFPFVVDRNSSWTEIFHSVLSQNEHASRMGLFAERSVPHEGLSDSIHSLVPALSQATPPTAVLVRSRSRGESFDDDGELASRCFCGPGLVQPRRTRSTALAGCVVGGDGGGARAEELWQ